MIALTYGAIALLALLLGLHFGLQVLVSIAYMDIEAEGALEDIAWRGIAAMNIVVLFASIATVAWRMGGLT